MSTEKEGMIVAGQKHVVQVIQKHDDMLEEHGTQLKVQAEQIKQLQDHSIKLENIVMSESRDTRLTITETNKQLMEVVNGVLGYKNGQNQVNKDMSIARWESIIKIISMVAGSGGILYWLFGQ